MKEKSVIQQRIEKFENEHGGRTVAVQSVDGAYWLFPDGARRDTNPAGVLDMPELNHHPYRGNREAFDWEILKRKVEYHTAKDDGLQKAYEHQRQEMANRDWSQTEWNALVRMGKRLTKARKELEAILEERDEHPTYQSQQMAREQQDNAQARNEEKNRKLAKKRV